MNESADDELRAQFGELRTADMGDAPAFRELFGRADRAAAGTDRNERRRLSRLAIPIALAAAIVLTVGIARVARRRAFIQAPLSTWTSPTASLLRAPGAGLLAPPGILASVLDPAVRASIPSKGTKQ